MNSSTIYRPNLTSAKWDMYATARLDAIEYVAIEKAVRDENGAVKFVAVRKINGRSCLVRPERLAEFCL